jgi:hypothetical protein
MNNQLSYNEHVNFLVIGCIEPVLSPDLHSAFVKLTAKIEKFVNKINSFIQVI